MTKEQIGKLLVTDQVRRGSVAGTVVQSTPTHLKICWDGQGNTPTTYSKETGALKDVRIEHQAERTERDGKAFVLFTRPCAPETRGGEDFYDSI